MVVEDNELNVMLITVLLKRMGHSFDLANDGEEALDLFKKNIYGLILTDINIPKFTGVQISEIFRKDKIEQKAAVPIVALTADTIRILKIILEPTLIKFL